MVVDDRLVWVRPGLEFKTFYFTAAFNPGAAQGPVRLVRDGAAASFTVTSSGGRKVPEGIAYPATAENFLKSGYKVSVRTVSLSFDPATPNTYFYERPWQQDWFQLSGFMYRLPAGKPVEARHEVIFAKAGAAEMPPVVTIHSPPWDARWLDEKGEVARYRIGDTVKLSASAVNSDGTPVRDGDISWEVHVDPWWNTPAATLRGGTASYTLPDVTNEVDREKSKDRNLLAVFTVTVKGNNGTVAVETVRGHCREKALNGRCKTSDHCVTRSGAFMTMWRWGTSRVNRTSPGNRGASFLAAALAGRHTEGRLTGRAFPGIASPTYRAFRPAESQRFGRAASVANAQFLVARQHGFAN